MSKLVRVKGSCHSFPKGCVVDSDNKDFINRAFKDDEFEEFNGHTIWRDVISGIKFSYNHVVQRYFPSDKAHIQYYINRFGSKENSISPNWENVIKQVESANVSAWYCHGRTIFKLLITGPNPF